MSINQKLNKNLPKIGLALSGGASWGVAHIGALKMFEEAGLKFDMIAGTSIGALAGAFHAFGISNDTMLEQAEEMSWYSISRLTLSRSGILTNTIIGDIIREHIGNVNIEDAQIPLAIIATDIKTGEKIVLRKGNLAQAVMASSCIPGVFKPIELDGRLLVDGFLVENLPTKTLREMGANFTIGVSLNTMREYREPTGMINIILNAFEIAIDSNLSSTLEQADILINPDLSNIAFEDEKRVFALFNEGYIAAKKNVPEINRRIHQLFDKEPASVWQRIKGAFLAPQN